MSKKNRRPDKGQPGSRAAQRAAKAEQVARQRAEQVAQQRWAEQAAETVARVIAEVAADPLARVRAPYQPPREDWARAVSQRYGITSREEMLAGVDVDALDVAVEELLPQLAHRPEDLPAMVVMQAEEFYDGGAHGMTSVAQMMLESLNLTAGQFRAAHGREITAEDIAPLPAAVVMASAEMLLNEGALDFGFAAAYVATGYLITQETLPLFTDEEREQWARLIIEARHRFPGWMDDNPLVDVVFADDLLPTVLHPQIGHLVSDRLHHAYTALLQGEPSNSPTTGTASD